MTDEETVKNLERGATSGDAETQYQLGLSYLTRKGVEEAPRKGVKWLRRAATQNHDSAAVKLGECYEQGIGVEVDLKKAAKFYRQAANNHHVVAQYTLGACYEHGIGVEADPKAAVDLYRSAAKSNHADALRKLGECYEHGIGVAPDPHIAVEWYQHSADQGNAAAQISLGFCYRQGIGVGANPSQAVQWYKRAADQEYPAGMDNLGYCYQHGLGVEKDEVQAFKWYLLAAEKGSVVSQYNLAYCYEHGTGVLKDLEVAVQWYTKAANSGHSGAQWTLGYCYEQGIGVEKDESAAEYWYEMSGENGEVLANTIRSPRNSRKLTRRPTPDQKPAKTHRGKRTVEGKTSPSVSKGSLHLKKLKRSTNTRTEPKRSSKKERQSLPKHFFGSGYSEKIPPGKKFNSNNAKEFNPGRVSASLYANLIDTAVQLVALCDVLTKPPVESSVVAEVNKTLEELARFVGEMDQESRPAIMKKSNPLIFAVKALRNASVEDTKPKDDDLKEYMLDVLQAVQLFTQEMEQQKSITSHSETLLSVLSPPLDDSISGQNSGPVTEGESAERAFRDKVMTELLITEKSYGEGLEIAVTCWANPMKESVHTKRALATAEQSATMFASLETVYNLHVVVLTRLKEKKDNIGEIFYKLADMMKLYIDYVNKYENMVKTYSDLCQNKQFRNFDSEASAKSGKGNLMGILITPVQRLPRYQLLLESLLKNTNPSHPDYHNLEAALQKMRSVNHMINEKKTRLRKPKKNLTDCNYYPEKWKTTRPRGPPPCVYLRWSIGIKLQKQGQKERVYLFNE